jgi:hypothetical protein
MPRGEEGLASSADYVTLKTSFYVSRDETVSNMYSILCMHNDIINKRIKTTIPCFHFPIPSHIRIDQAGDNHHNLYQ